MRGQVAARYPQARIQTLDPDDNLLDAGSAPLIVIIRALSSLNGRDRVVARLLLHSF